MTVATCRTTTTAVTDENATARDVDAPTIPEIELLDLAPGPFVFLSPHLDDVALSCSALVAELAQRAPVTVISVFTEAGPPPHTLSARAFLRQCGARDGAGLYAERRAEDVRALTALGAVAVHLGFADAVFRRKADALGARRRPGRPAMMDSAYPTYRWHIKRGVVAPGDEATVDAVARAVQHAIAEAGAQTVVAPMGIGGHVDHRIVARFAEDHLPGVVYYADLPYALIDRPDSGLLDRQQLVAMAWKRGYASKPTHLSFYTTQMAALFPQGRIPDLPECYFAPLEQIRCV